MRQDFTKCCGQPDYMQDFQSGDTVCTNCGYCNQDIMLDMFGNAPATIQQQNFDPDSDTSHQRSKRMREIVEHVLLAMNMSDAFGDTAFRMVTELYNTGKSLRGTDLVHLGVAIVHRVAMENEIHFDSDLVQMMYGAKIMGRIQKLQQHYLPKQTQSTQSDLSINRKLTFQKFVLKKGTELGLMNPVIPAKLSDQLSSLPKSTKIKTAVALYIMEPTKLKDICKAFKQTKSGLKRSVNEIEGMVKVNFGLFLPTRNPLRPVNHTNNEFKKSF